MASVLLAVAGAEVCAEDPFSIVVLPDTQAYASGDGSFTYLFCTQTQWAADNAVASNILFVLHEGDITDVNSTAEWQRARSCTDIMDGYVPYALAVGNHDLSATSGVPLGRDSSMFNAHYPATNFTGLPTFGGLYETGMMDNCYHLFSGGGVDWMILVLELGPRDEVLSWASQVVTSHPNHRVIMLTHSHLYYDDTLLGSKPGDMWSPHNIASPANDGYEVWEKFLRKHPNIAMVFSGHVLGDGTARSVMTGDYGNRVYQMLANYQMNALGGSAYMRYLRFIPDDSMVEVTSYSPFLDAYLTDSENAFSFTNVAWFDPSPPSPPTIVATTVLDQTSGYLAWSPSTDAESGIGSYAVLRDGQEIAICTGTNYTDQVLAENTSYMYTVQAVNKAGLRSAASLSATVQTPLDSEAPRLLSVASFEDGNHVLAVFSEPLDPAAATNTGRYRIGGKSTVYHAGLSQDGTRVSLTTSFLQMGRPYTFSVMNMPDRSVSQNVLAEAQSVFRPVERLLTETFNDGDMVGWTAVDEGLIFAPSAWAVVATELRQTSVIYGDQYSDTVGRKGTFVYWNDPAAFAWSNYTFQLRFRSHAQNAVGVFFRYQDTANYYKVEFDHYRRFSKLLRNAGGVETTLAEAWKGIPTNQTVELRIHCQDNEMEITLDGTNIFGGIVTDSALAEGTVALYTWANWNVFFDDVFIDATVDDVVIDEDVDGLIDTWEQQIVNENTNDAIVDIEDVLYDDDYDMDGMANRAEQLSVTDPTDNSSFLHVRHAVPSVDALSLRWTSQSNVTYSILRSTNLVDGYVTYATNIAATPPTNTWMIPSAQEVESAYFYTITVED